MDTSAMFCSGICAASKEIFEYHTEQIHILQKHNIYSKEQKYNWCLFSVPHYALRVRNYMCLQEQKIYFTEQSIDFMEQNIHFNQHTCANRYINTHTQTQKNREIVTFNFSLRTRIKQPKLNLVTAGRDSSFPSPPGAGKGMPWLSHSLTTVSISKVILQKGKQSRRGN